ncbi:MAG TPA: Hsp20/alpha crystallin family protein [Roseiflexaceae bacterium]|nr:Hsp20/alpha crystallin family protein [Roseiflexaceae bacterium]
MANVTRWDPMQEMLSLREAMNQLLEESFVTPTATRRGQGFVPAMDVSETQDAFVVELVAPGLRSEDLEITLENSVLTIKGEIRQEPTDTKRQYHRVERRYGSFSRTLTLPTTVKGDAISATLEHGILRLDIPKAEEVKPRKISVSVNRNN